MHVEGGLCKTLRPTTLDPPAGDRFSERFHPLWWTAAEARGRSRLGSATEPRTLESVGSSLNQWLPEGRSPGTAAARENVGGARIGDGPFRQRRVGRQQNRGRPVTQWLCFGPTRRCLKGPSPILQSRITSAHGGDFAGLP